MVINQFRIKINTDSNSKRIYVASGFNFGFALQYLINGNNCYKINPAAVLFLAKFKEQYSEQTHQKKIKITVGASNVIFSFISNLNKFNSDADVFKETLGACPDKESFDLLKNNFQEDYASRYNEDIRNELYFFEFLHQNKRFSMKQWHESIKNLTFEDVKRVQEFIFSKSQYKLYIRGNLSKDDSILEVFKTKEEIEFSQPMVVPLSQSDIVGKKLKINGSLMEQCTLVHTPAVSLDINDIFLVFQLLSAYYSQYSSKIVIDFLEMGMIIPDQVDLQGLDLSYNVMDSLKLSILTQFEYLIMKKSQFYAEYYVKLWLSGIDYISHYNNVKNLSVEDMRTKISYILERSLFCQVIFTEDIEVKNE